MPSGNACYKVKGAIAKTNTASKTHTLQGKAACSRVATTSKPSRVATSKPRKVATSRVATTNKEEATDSRVQEEEEEEEEVMAHQVSKADTTKEVALPGRAAVRDSTATFR